MDLSLGNISAMVFKRVVARNFGQLSLDGQALTVLMEIDGKQTVGTIAQKTGLNMATLRTILSGLLGLKLIETCDEAFSFLDEDFLDSLNDALALAVGPIAGVLIDDAITDTGHKRLEIPEHKAAELVDLLSRNIRREEKMIEFKQDMIRKMKEKGY